LLEAGLIWTNENRMTPLTAPTRTTLDEVISLRHQITLAIDLFLITLNVWRLTANWRKCFRAIFGLFFARSGS
jgi:hypothetical protein